MYIVCVPKTSKFWPNIIYIKTVHKDLLAIIFLTRHQCCWKFLLIHEFHAQCFRMPLFFQEKSKSNRMTLFSYRFLCSYLNPVEKVGMNGILTKSDYFTRTYLIGNGTHYFPIDTHAALFTVLKNIWNVWDSH